MSTVTQLRAIHQHGVLRLLDPLELPEGALVNVHVLLGPPDPADKSDSVGLVYPTHLVPAERLDDLTGLVAMGGDALADSEALYD